jgi:hypothetical protein
MQPYRFRAALIGAVLVAFVPLPAYAQHEGHEAAPTALPHRMWSAQLGAGWRLLGMAQAFPVVTISAPGETGPLRETGWYISQPAIMANLESPGSRVTFRTTLNFEGLTQEHGELTSGGWGEGFIDSRHPHTLLHEAMVSVNGWTVLGGHASLSAGKGFAPYGTDDPMARPGLKYPTNHHLSQILERWTVNGVFARSGWSVEAGLFGGNEPDSPWDFSNIESFANSWSARLARRWGAGDGPMAAWEASASFGNVTEEHDTESQTTRLWNVALRHDGTIGSGRLYALVEFSRSSPEHQDGFFSLLGEAQLTSGNHKPYVRIEYATRPEYVREGSAGSDEFFRYDHDAEPIGATRWFIGTVGWGVSATHGAVSLRPFAEAQLDRVSLDEGSDALEPAALFGTDTFWNVSLGLRVFFGGDPMRMGAYGVLDPMPSVNRSMAPMPMEQQRDAGRPEAQP